ncbi:MAG: MgtC/SapB family protein [archaeon]|nr:MgtC/SapB family protein [archaeon]
MELSTLILRFFLTFIFTLIFGLERQRKHKPIGFGTFTFVAVGACALAVTAVTFEPINPLPLLSAIVTSIGFLGAGALIKTTDKIFGFTSAATIWLFAIFGLLIGVGEYFHGLVLYSTVWIVMSLDSIFQKKGLGSYQRRITIQTNRIIENEDIQLVLGKQKTKTKTGRNGI